MSSIKQAQPDHAILDCIAQRWSPYLFESRDVEPEKLWQCLEAARWAASSFNEQPWSFIVAFRQENAEFQKVLECLVEANQSWAGNAGVLLLTIAAKSFSRNGSPNRVAVHDLGLAVGNFSCQATHLGLAVHQMAGLNLSKARQDFAIPETHEPVTAIAVGYAQPASSGTNGPLADRDVAPRSRKPLDQFVFSSAYGNSAKVRP